MKAKISHIFLIKEALTYHTAYIGSYEANIDHKYLTVQCTGTTKVQMIP